MASGLTPHTEFTRLSDLIDSIYSCITNPARWERVIAAVVAWVDAPRGLLFTPLHSPDKGGFYFNSGFSPGAMELWSTRYLDQDPWTAQCVRLGLYREGNVINGDRCLPYERLIRTAFYREFLSRQDSSHVLVGIVYGEDSPGRMPVVVSAFHRGIRQGCFWAREEQRLRILVPHLSRALGVMHRLRDAELKVASSLAALERLSAGVLLINEDHHVVHANHAARCLLDEQDGLSLQPVCARQSRDRLSVKDPQAAEAARAAVRESVTPDITAVKHFSRSIAVARPSGRPPYVLNFSTLPQHNAFGSGADVPRAIVFITGGDEPVQLDTALWRGIYRLTAAEVRVLRGIAEGLDQDEMAARLGISANTLKSHLKNIYAKAGVSSRPALMKRVFSLCGQVV